MKFGLFGSAKLNKINNDIDSSLSYNEWIDYNVEAEKLGFESTFTVEHHFTGLGQVSASLNLLTYLAAKTSKIKLGTAVITLPWHNPVLLAEQVATMDLLSKGRIQLGVGKGYRYNEFKGFKIDMNEARRLGDKYAPDEMEEDRRDKDTKRMNETKKILRSVIKVMKMQVANFKDYITEDKKGNKNHVIEGVFMQADSKNRNGRIYEKKILEAAVEKYIKEQVSTGRAVGELNHPEGPTVNLDKVSHKITELKWDGSNVIGKASILKTPMGQIVEGLLEGGVKLGVSSRGMGSLVQKNGTSYVGKDFMLATVDIVQDPSAPEAFVNGIMEGVEWVWDNGILKAQDIEIIETEIKTAKNTISSDIEIRAFKNFLSKLVNSK